MNEFEYNRLAYNKTARAYQKHRQSATEGAWNTYLEFPAMEKLLRTNVKNKLVLDLGCGTGLLSSKIVDWGAEVHGIDQAEEMIAIAKRSHPNILFTVANVNNIPFKDNSFQIISSSLVMHYIKDIKPVFKEIARVLEPNGKFIFSIHHPIAECLKGNKMQGKDNQPLLEPYFHSQHYYWEMCNVEFLSFHHTFEEIIQSLCSAGFSVTNLIECQPDKTLSKQFDEYQYTINYPTFCVFEAAKC